MNGMSVPIFDSWRDGRTKRGVPRPPWILLLLSLFILSSCGGGGGSSSPPLYKNQISVTLSTNQNSNINTPVVSLTVCVPGTSICQPISDILLDTGSVGLRLSHSALSIPLPQSTYQDQDVFECFQFSSGDNFGPVVTADVTLGGEPTIHGLPVQVSNASITPPPSQCSSISSFSGSGINGILGVGYPFNQHDYGYYYLCSSTSWCQAKYDSSYPNSSMVSNPVFSLPTDNGGILVTLPAISQDGAANVAGTLTLGLDTQSDNQTGGLTRYAIDTQTTCGQSLYLSASYLGSSGSSCAFLDSGSNGMFFGTTTFPLCSNNQWYCPSPSPASLSLSLTGANNVTGSYTLSVLNFTSIQNSTNHAWNDDAGPFGGSTPVFDAGLPFFFGRTVAVGFSVNGQTPFWAF
jgi:hypothetical protein